MCDVGCLVRDVFDVRDACVMCVCVRVMCVMCVCVICVPRDVWCMCVCVCWVMCDG